MPKSDAFPKIKPNFDHPLVKDQLHKPIGVHDYAVKVHGYKPMNLKGKTLWELYRLQEKNTNNMVTLKYWLKDIQDPLTYNVWKSFDDLRKRLNRAIYLKRLKLWLLSLVGRN